MQFLFQDCAKIVCKAALISAAVAGAMELCGATGTLVPPSFLPAVEVGFYGGATLSVLTMGALAGTIAVLRKFKNTNLNL